MGLGGVGGWSDYGNFPLLYVLKMSLCSGLGGSKKAKISYVIKIGPNL